MVVEECASTPSDGTQPFYTLSISALNSHTREIYISHRVDLAPASEATVVRANDAAGHRRSNTPSRGSNRMRNMQVVASLRTDRRGMVK